MIRPREITGGMRVKDQYMGRKCRTDVLKRWRKRLMKALSPRVPGIPGQWLEARNRKVRANNLNGELPRAS